MSGVLPTQELPSWLSYSSFTTVDGSGHPTVETTIVTLPLTYYGPSIPLGTNGVWTYGGLTSPVSATSAPSTTTAVLSKSSPAPTTTLSSHSNAPSSSTLLISSSTLFPTHASSTTSMITPNPSGGSLSRPHKLSGTSIAAIAVVVSFICILLAFGLFLCCRRSRYNLSPAQRVYQDLESRLSLRRKRQSRQEQRQREAMLRDAEPLVTGETPTEPGASIPPRLVSSAPRTSPALGASQIDDRMTPSSTFTSLIRDDMLVTSGIRSTSSLFFHENASEVEEPGYVALSPPHRRATPHSQLTHPSAPLLPPPSINPDGGRPMSQVTSRSNRSAIPSIAYPDSPISDVDETAALMTATRVRVDSGDSTQARGFSMGIARLGRLSWFDRTPPDDDPRYQSSVSSGRSSGSARGRRVMTERSRASLAVSQGHRYSINAGSASSGPTIYYDASSRPRSQVSAGGLAPDQWGYVTPDILDMPAPPSAAATFSSSASRPAHLRHPPGLHSDEHETLTDTPPLPEERWHTVQSVGSSRSYVKDESGSRILIPQASALNLAKDDISQDSHTRTSITETLPLIAGEEEVEGMASRPRANTYTSLGTSETIVTDAGTGAVMHFPTKIWRSSQGEGQWPEDAWTEFPAPGQAKWYGPPSTLKRYREQTGDPGTL